jgi:AAA domain
MRRNDQASAVAESLAATPPVVDAADLMGRTFPDEPALVGGGLILPRTVCINGGPAKRGKSILLLNREICRALARPFLGFTTTPGRTLYIQSEIPERQLQQRLALMLAEGPELEPIDPEALRGHLLTVTKRGLFIDEPDGYDIVRSLIEKTAPDLVSIDPLARFMTGDENSSRDMGRIINSLDRLVEQYQIAIELTHHTGKQSASEPRQGGQRLRGSSALFGAADTVSILDFNLQDATWLLTFELRHAGEPPPMRLQRTSNLWFTGAGPSERLLEVSRLVADIPMRWGTLKGAVMADTKCSERTAERLIRDAKKAALIWQGDDGSYRQAAAYRQRARDGEANN